jgi:two-component system OmpR family sensor kinase
VPVRWRLTLAFTVVMAVLLAATGLFVHGRVQSSLDGALDRSLRSRAADVAALAQQSDTGLSDSRNAGVLGQAQLAQVLDRNGRVIDKTPNLASRPLLDPSQVARARSGVLIVGSTAVGADHRVRLLAAPTRAQGQNMVVVVGQSLEERDQALSNLTAVLILGGPIALVLAALAGFALTGFALRPVESMRRRAQTISATDLGGRLPSAGGNDELGRLGRTLNEMLERIQEAVARERTFVSDASHELRSPLAALRTELELLAREHPTGAALDEASRSAIEETDRLARLADDLLLLSRADDNSFALARASVPALELAVEASERARRRAAPDAPEVTVADRGELSVDVDRERIAQALDNMLENALRHALHAIELTCEAREGRVEIHVRDDGPGFPDGFLPHAWDRFSRADPGRTDGGAGLGLSIVRTIAELHGGEAGAANRPEGGADVWIALPPARDSPRRSSGFVDASLTPSA